MPDPKLPAVVNKFLPVDAMMFWFESTRPATQGREDTIRYSDSKQATRDGLDCHGAPRDEWDYLVARQDEVLFVLLEA